MVKISFTLLLSFIRDINLNIEDYLEKENIFLKVFYQDEEFYPDKIKRIDDGKYIFILSHINKDVDNKIKQMEDDKIKNFIVNKYTDKFNNYNLKIINLTMPPFSRQVFSVSVKFFIKGQNVNQSEVDKFSTQIITTYTGEEIERYKYLIQSAFETNYSVRDIKYNNSHAYFELRTDLNNVNIVTKNELLNEILNIFSFEDGIYGGSDFIYSTEPAVFGGYYEHNLDFRKEKNISIN
jgi:hypothetical protein